MKIITPEQFIFEVPPYELLYYKEEEENEAEEAMEDLLEIIDEGEKMIEDIICFDGKIDGPCIHCGKATTYKRKGDPPPRYDLTNILGISRTLGLTLCCSRDEKHEIEIIFKTFPDIKAFIKIGQFPSIATLTKGEIKKYRKILGDRFEEFSRGIGLISHGVGIGSIVYIRRVFESLVEEAHDLAAGATGWDENSYLQARMDGKIDILKSHLPSFLVKHKSLYGILSKGIHELSEQECLEIFPVVKLGIELILDEKIKHQEKIEKEKEGSELITKIAAKLKNEKGP